MLHHSIYAKKKPDVPALIMSAKNEVVTWREFDQRINRLAQYFIDIGLQPKDHIAICMENNSQYLVTVTAAIDAGLIYTPISTHLKLSEVQYIINNCGAKVLITSQYKQDLAEELLDATPDVMHRLLVGGTVNGYESLEDILGRYPAKPIPLGIAGDFMFYSSGTTGRPKGVLPEIEDVQVGEVRRSRKLYHSLYQMNEEMVYLCPAPLYHAAPLGFSNMTLDEGGTLVVMEKFDAEESLQCIEKYRVTHSQWVPTMFLRMIKLPEKVRLKYDLSSMKMAIHAAAPCPINVKEQMIEWWGPVFLEYYAGTERNTMVMINSKEWMEHKGSVGKCYVGKIHILDDEENEMPVGEPGLVYIEDGIPFEYHGEPKKTAETRSSKGWTTLGDIGTLDEEGYLYLTDRKSNMIISGGVNIYPQETENLLIQHPKVLDAAVIGIPHEEFGEEVKAVVELKNMDEAGPELEKELIAYCRENISHIKSPKSIDFSDDIPRTPTGKMVKRLLKERYWGKTR